MGKEKFMFFQNFKETADKLPPELRLKFYDALTDYVFYGKESENPVISALVNAFKPSLTKEDGRKNNGGNHNPKGVNQYTKSGQSLVNSGQSCSIPLETETETETENTPPIIPPKGDRLQQNFKNLWNNTLVPWYRSKFPLSPPIPQITTKSLKNLSARDRELKGLAKELIADGVVKPEDVGNDVWRWAFACVADRIAKSSFLRGECRPDDNHRQFVFSVDYFLRPSAFIKLVSPLSKYCLDDKGGGL